MFLPEHSLGGRWCRLYHCPALGPTVYLGNTKTRNSCKWGVMYYNILSFACFSPGVSLVISLSVASGMVALVFHCCCFSMMKFLLSAATRFFLDTLAGFNPCTSSSESRSFFSTLLGYIGDERTPKNLTHMVVQTDLCFCVLCFCS